MSTPDRLASRTPRVSVVIPTFNRARDLARCLESLVRQTYQDFEVLVCDDGSTDNSADVAKQFESRLAVSYHWDSNWGGPARPRNNGLKLAKGEFVAFLDSDDWWAPEKLAESVQALDTGADFVYHDLYLVFDAGVSRHEQKSGSRALKKPVLDDLLGNGNAINNSSVVTRVALMREIGGFAEDRDLIAAEDYDAWLRLARLTDAFVRLPRCLGFYWVVAGNISNPKRTVSTSLALEKRYADDLARVGASRHVWWLKYTMARAHYLQGHDADVRRELRAAGWWPLPLAIKSKALWMYCASLLRPGRA
jgi:glycosyltransferase involved in cell wall biosynthesis